MLAAEGLSIYLASKKIDVQVLSFEYQRLFPEGYFFHAGLANFTSQVEYHWDAFESSYDDEATEEEVAKLVEELLPCDVTDITDVFSNCQSKMVVDSLADGAKVLAVKLANFAGRIGSKQLDASGAQMPRLGRELASAAKLAGVRGIFHSDELPKYGITETEVAVIKSELSVGENDGFI